MEIHDAYVVYVNLDGDVRTETSGLRVFAGAEAPAEVRALIRTALTDMNRGHLERYGERAYADVDGYDVPLDKVIADDELLDEVINYGGVEIGNWEVTVDRTGDDG